MSDEETLEDSDAIAELAITDPTGPTWQIANPEATRFEARKHLGPGDAPAFAIGRQIDPDEPWSFEAIDGGPRIDPAPAPLVDALGALAGDAHAADLAGLIVALPAGEYLVVRLNAAVEKTGEVLLGNHLEDRPPPHLAPLADISGSYALAIGPGRAPDTSRPLLGVVALNYTGDWRPLAGLFFDVLDGPAPSPGLASPVVIIPKSGPLVFDNMSHYSGHDSGADRTLWRDRDALEYARALAGVS